MYSRRKLRLSAAVAATLWLFTACGGGAGSGNGAATDTAGSTGATGAGGTTGSTGGSGATSGTTSGTSSGTTSGTTSGATTGGTATGGSASGSTGVSGGGATGTGSTGSASAPTGPTPPVVGAAGIAKSVAATFDKWSDPATWGGAGVPGAGATVVIPADRSILLDVSPPALGTLRVDGKLVVKDQDVTLTANSIAVSGLLQAGTSAEPFAGKAVITLTGAPSADTSGAVRGLIVSGGTLLLVGTPTTRPWTHIAADAAAGAKQMDLDQAVDWRAGDQIVVSPTDFYGLAGGTEQLSLASATPTRIATSTGLQNFRWGKLQYVTRTGISLSPDAGFVPPEAPTPTVLDERAVVGNLTRNIVIQGADDTYWATSHFGAHVMVTGHSALVNVEGVEFRRVGQAGQMGRYPFHWHMMSYDTAGNTLGDVPGNFIRSSAIWSSGNRCVVIHGTNGVEVRDNVCYDIRGHAFFLEDAVERRNVIEGNLALKMRSPDPGQMLLAHEGDVYLAGPTGFWLTNPDNTVRYNHAADAKGNGFWLSYPRSPHGLSKLVPMLPDRLPHGRFEYNVSHSNRNPGLLLDFAVTDDAGHVSENVYIPTKDGSEDQYDKNRIQFELKGVTSFKNMGGAYRNRASWPQYLEWVSADNTETSFVGQVDNGLLTRSVIVGTSLNNATPYPANPVTEPLAAFASYHSTLSMSRNVVINFPLDVNAPWSGAFKTDDYYMEGVDMGLVHNVGNMLINSHPGLRTLPPIKRTDAELTPDSHWTLSGALWDANGYWGPAGRYWVYDDPFLTAGADCVPVQPAPRNGYSCVGPYFGVKEFSTDFDHQPYMFESPLDVRRLDDAGNEIGNWQVQDGTTLWALGNMRHFAARPGGRYLLNFPGRSLPRWVEFDVTSMLTANDWVLIGVALDGSVTPSTVTLSFYGTDRTLSAAPDLATVLSAPGTRYLQDKPGNRLWVKFQRGSFALPSANDLYAPIHVSAH